MDKFDIINEIQAPTPKQLCSPSVMINHRMVVQEASYYREALLRILNDRIDFSLLKEKEILIIKYTRTGRHKIDYSSIKNRKAKSFIKSVIDNNRSHAF